MKIRSALHFSIACSVIPPKLDQILAAKAEKSWKKFGEVKRKFPLNLKIPPSIFQYRCSASSLTRQRPSCSIDAIRTAALIATLSQPSLNPRKYLRPINRLNMAVCGPFTRRRFSFAAGSTSPYRGKGFGNPGRLTDAVAFRSVNPRFCTQRCPVAQSILVVLASGIN